MKSFIQFLSLTSWKLSSKDQEYQQKFQQGKSDHINGTITLSMITLSSFHCTLKYCKFVPPKKQNILIEFQRETGAGCKLRVQCRTPPTTRSRTSQRRRNRIDVSDLPRRRRSKGNVGTSFARRLLQCRRKRSR